MFLQCTKRIYMFKVLIPLRDQADTICCVCLSSKCYKQCANIDLCLNFSGPTRTGTREHAYGITNRLNCLISSLY